MDEKNSQLEILLKKIDELKTEHAKEDVFNAFQIFRLNDKEVMHSRFIKSLLNPNEIHGYKDDFLKLFLDRINIEDFNTDGVTTECEKNTHNNRYIDIAIENKNSRQMIIIENKIWAGDLDNQLLDYHNYGLNLYENKSENIFMIYLTPYGKQYGNNSFPREKEQPKNGIKCISYEKDILEWLEACLKHINGNNSRLQTCIEMYIELIRKTINRDKYMEEIVKALLSDSGKMKSAIDIVKALQYKNFIEHNSSSRDIIMKRIICYFEEYNFEDTDEGDKENDWYTLVFRNKNVELEIVFAEGFIYENHLGDKFDLKINCTNIQDKYLVALLTNDTVLIREWITKTIFYVTGEAENL